MHISFVPELLHMLYNILLINTCALCILHWSWSTAQTFEKVTLLIKIYPLKFCLSEKDLAALEFTLEPDLAPQLDNCLACHDVRPLLSHDVRSSLQLELKGYNIYR